MAAPLLREQTPGVTLAGILRSEKGRKRTAAITTAPGESQAQGRSRLPLRDTCFLQNASRVGLQHTGLVIGDGALLAEGLDDEPRFSQFISRHGREHEPRNTAWQDSQGNYHLHERQCDTICVIFLFDVSYEGETESHTGFESV